MAIELAYINTKHPDFDEAKLIYRGMSDDMMSDIEPKTKTVSHSLAKQVSNNICAP